MLAASLVPTTVCAEEIQNMIRYFDKNGVAHHVGSLEQVPPEYRAGAKAPDSNQQMPPVTSMGNDWYSRQARELEHKRRREEREKQLEKARPGVPKPAATGSGTTGRIRRPQALTDAVERERRLQERKAAQDARAAEHAKWLRSCERPERFVEHERARHWLAYGQRWSDEEAAARKRRAIAESGCQPLK